jgi:hypothetical protein
MSAAVLFMWTARNAQTPFIRRHLHVIADISMAKNPEPGDDDYVDYDGDEYGDTECVNCGNPLRQCRSQCVN